MKMELKQLTVGLVRNVDFVQIWEGRTLHHSFGTHPLLMEQTASFTPEQNAEVCAHPIVDMLCHEIVRLRQELDQAQAMNNEKSRT